MLTYLDANLHPDKYAKGAGTDSPAATLPAAVALDHQLRASSVEWRYKDSTGLGFRSGEGLLRPW